MTLRCRTLLLLGVALIGLVLAIYLSIQDLTWDSIYELEDNSVRSNLARVENALLREAQAMEAVTADYSQGDDTYSYIEDRNTVFLDNNLADSTFINLRFNIMAFYDNQGQLLYGKGYDLLQQSEIPYPQSLTAMLIDRGAVLRSSEERWRFFGLMMLPEGPMLVCSTPIITSAQKGPVQGSLVSGRFLNPAVITHLATTTQLDLKITALDTISAEPAYEPILAQLNLPGNQPVIFRLDNELIGGYQYLKDVKGEPALLIEITQPRDIYKAGLQTVTHIAAVIAFWGLIFGLLVLVFMENSLLSRLMRLNREVAAIGKLEDFSARVSQSGHDEISQLADSVNFMMGELEESHARLLENDLRLRRINDHMLDIVSQVNAAGMLQYASPSFTRVLGYDTEVLLNSSFLRLIHEDDQGHFSSMMSDVIRSLKPAAVELRLKNVRGDYLWMEMMMNPIINEMEVSGAVLAGRDITVRKQAQDRIRYISYHDSLTGLYNRTYFEQEMMALKRSEGIPMALFVCDLDGLKIINDTLGHRSGDWLLQRTAQLLKGCCGPDDIIARIGGDEFALLMHNCNRIGVEYIYQLIKERVEQHNASNPEIPMAISIGYAIRYDPNFSMASLFQEADNNMYREKLHSKQSGHSGLVATLMQALQERDFVTGGHVDRMDELVRDMGEILGLTSNQINDLCLLARFHDIGKVGIPDAILFKPGPLTADEYEQMQQHTEIGYRIARAATDLQPIADWILKHHEWWNGAGYPLGLKGDEIPLECRILAIVDAFDAIISVRPYRAARSVAEALQELELNAGIQFDPFLVEIFVQMINTKKSPAGVAD
jgi:diguanylate cyclase (GGDEF)-like protein/PAS domain S-box-containing protein